jgi:hypothetical protein
LSIPTAALVGSWKLMSFQIVDEGGAVYHPMGEQPQGYITYGADGYMQVNIQTAGRERFLTDDFLDPKPADPAEAMRYIAYAGSYRLEADRIVHHIEVSFFPNWIGVDQVRYARLEDDLLILSTPPLTYRGRPGRATLRWKRVAPSLP